MAVPVGRLGAVSAGIARRCDHGAWPFVAIPRVALQLLCREIERFQVEMTNSGSELLDFFIKQAGGTHAVGVRR